MAETAITKAPSGKVSSMSAPQLTWSGTTLKVKETWKVPSALTDSSKADRATALRTWTDIISDRKQPRGRYYNSWDANWQHIFHEVSLPSATTASDEWSTSLAGYYPFDEAGPRIKEMWVRVQAGNAKGWADKNTATCKLSAPPMPAIAELTVDEQTGDLRFTVNAAAGSMYAPRQRTRWTLKVYSSGSKATSTLTGVFAGDTYTGSSKDLTNWQALTGGAYYRVTLTAKSMGTGGDSAERTRTLYVSRPKAPTLSLKAVSGTGANRIVALGVALNATTALPVTGCRLQMLRSVARTAPTGAEDGWEDVGTPDDGQCTQLAVSAAAVAPEPDTATFLRLKSWNIHEGVLMSYGTPLRLKALETDKAHPKGDKCAIVSATPSSSGTSATVVVGFTSYEAASRGTELSWAESAGAWTSVSGPSTHERADGDAGSKDPSRKSSAWNFTQTYTVDGLTQGKAYYVRARRWADDEGERAWGAYSARVGFETESAEDDACTVVSLAPDPSDRAGSLVCVVAYGDGTASDGCTGTEVSWSPDLYAWTSTKQPDSFAFAWHDSTKAGGASKWWRSATVRIRGLEEDEAYYVRARRYKEAGGTTTYGAWSARARCSTGASPTGAAAAADRCAIASLTVTSSNRIAAVTRYERRDAEARGIELSWSDHISAWTSTTGPSTIDIADGDLGWKSISDGGWKVQRTTYIDSGIEAGKTYYVRARRWVEEGGVRTYGAYTPSGVSVTIEGATDDACTILMATSGTDGTTGRAYVGFKADSNSGTELSWSANARAWTSNAAPESMVRTGRISTTGASAPTWPDDADTSKWPWFQYFDLVGLAPEEVYYIRARRVDGDMGETAGAWCAAAKLSTVPYGRGTADNDTVTIHAVRQKDAAGTVAEVIVGISEDAVNTGTELTWSDRADAWTSTSQPSSFEATWLDPAERLAAYKKDGTVPRSCSRCQTIEVPGLEPGTGYWFRARRYLDGEVRTYGQMTDPAMPLTMQVAPGAVELVAPAWVRSGRSLTVSWTYEADVEQARYVVQALRNGTPMSGSVGAESPTTGCTLPWSWVRAHARNGALALRVAVDTGTGLTWSQAAEVEVAEQPTVALSVTDLTAQPLSVGLTCSDAGCAVALSVTAVGCAGDGPGGAVEQAEGDAVWSAAVSPEWTAGDGAAKATVELPGGLPFMDGAAYTVRAVATDARGIESEAAEATFRVGWSRKAPAPGMAAVTPYDVTDPEGVRTRGCRIALASPADAEGTDTCEVYRLTPDGARIVARGLATDAVVDDPYAPFGGDGLAYRVALVTSDGDADWLDFGYELAGEDIRIDWPGGYVELPYDIALGDGYSKGYEARHHIGQALPQGYWDGTMDRRGSLSTDLVRVRDRAKADALRALARHLGSAFVRTPDGCAYEADVQVGAMDSSHGSGAVAVSLDAGECMPTGAFDASIVEGEV